MAEGAAPAEQAAARPAQEYPEFGRTLGKECRRIEPARFVGRPATAALSAKARDLAGAATVRWIRPGSVVTMDYRTDRLNITLDSANKVVSLRCG